MKKIVIFAMAMAISVTVPISVMAGNIVQTDAEMKKLEEVADELNVKILGPDLFRFAVRK